MGLVPRLVAGTSPLGCVDLKDIDVVFLVMLIQQHDRDSLSEQSAEKRVILYAPNHKKKDAHLTTKKKMRDACLGPCHRRLSKGVHTSCIHSH